MSYLKGVPFEIWSRAVFLLLLLLLLLCLISPFLYSTHRRRRRHSRCFSSMLFHLTSINDICVFYIVTEMKHEHESHKIDMYLRNMQCVLFIDGSTYDEQNVRERANNIQPTIIFMNDLCFKKKERKKRYLCVLCKTRADTGDGRWWWGMEKSNMLHDISIDEFISHMCVCINKHDAKSKSLYTHQVLNLFSNDHYV